MTTGISPAIDNSPIEDIDPPVQKKAGKMRKRKSVVIEEVCSSPDPIGEPMSSFAFRLSHSLQTSLISPLLPQPLQLPLLLLLEGLMRANAESALQPVPDRVSFHSGSKDIFSHFSLRQRAQILPCTRRGPSLSSTKVRRRRTPTLRCWITTHCSLGALLRATTLSWLRRRAKWKGTR